MINPQWLELPMSRTNFHGPDDVRAMGGRLYYFDRILCTASYSIQAARAKPCFQAYADSEGPDHPAHSRSLIGAIIVHSQNHWILQNVWMESRGPEDILRMRWMAWICAFCACLKAHFAYHGPYEICSEVVDKNKWNIYRKANTHKAQSLQKWNSQMSNKHSL